MNTNRRGFFGALAGLAGGVYAAFVPGKRKVWGEDPKDWQINGGLEAWDKEHPIKSVSIEDLGGGWFRSTVTYTKGDKIVCEANTLTVWGFENDS